ncbi:hypothetical protein GCM10023347_43890 [Streptomyces chumphonensis]
MGIPFSIFFIAFGTSLIIFRERFILGALESQQKIFHTDGRGFEKAGRIMVFTMGIGMTLLGILGVSGIV